MLVLGDPEEPVVAVASAPSGLRLVDPLGALRADARARRRSSQVLVPRKAADRRSMNDTNTRLITSSMTAIAQA